MQGLGFYSTCKLTGLPATGPQMLAEDTDHMEKVQSAVARVSSISVSSHATQTPQNARKCLWRVLARAIGCTAKEEHGAKE